MWKRNKTLLFTLSGKQESPLANISQPEILAGAYSTQAKLKILLPTHGNEHTQQIRAFYRTHNFPITPFSSSPPLAVLIKFHQALSHILGNSLPLREVHSPFKKSALVTALSELDPHSSSGQMDRKSTFFQKGFVWLELAQCGCKITWGSGFALAFQAGFVSYDGAASPRLPIPTLPTHNATLFCFLHGGRIFIHHCSLPRDHNCYFILSNNSWTGISLQGCLEAPLGADCRRDNGSE